MFRSSVLLKFSDSGDPIVFAPRAKEKFQRLKPHAVDPEVKVLGF